MSRYLDIAQLSAEVLRSVAAPTSEKTAAPHADMQTDIGRALKLAAEKLSNFEEPGVTSEDLRDLVVGLRKHAEGTVGATMGGLAGGPAGLGGGGGGGNNPVNMSAPGPAPANPTGQIAQKLGSELGNELRKLAADVRKQGAEADESRVVKAAHMITAATGLKHLTATLTKS